ncbi:MAG: tyrosine-type recombinase/integrase [Bacteroidota bacterium]
MNSEIVPVPGAGNQTRRSLTLQAADQAQLPAVVEAAGDDARAAFLEFFFATIRNPNTRAAYARAVTCFFRWCEERQVGLLDIEPVVVAAYIEEHPGAPATVKQHLAAVRMLFDYLVTKQVVPTNPSTVVRGPKHVVKKGKTPVLSRADAKTLMASIPTANIVGLRDRALIATMLYSFARIGAVTGMRVRDYYSVGKRSWLRLLEKGGKHHEVPAHHLVQEYLDAYIYGAGFDDPQALLFQSVDRRRRLTGRALDRNKARAMLRRRARQAGLSERITNHSLRATGITVYLENGGTLEHAQAIAAHESPRTTKLYDRTSDAISLDEIERISL